MEAISKKHPILGCWNSILCRYLYEHLLLTWLPTYLMEARNFSLKEMGIAASFPWLAICFTVLAGGALSDIILQRTNSRMKARGSLALIGFIFSLSVCISLPTPQALG